MKNLKKKIGVTLIVLLIVIQFFRIDKTNPEVVLKNDFIAIQNPPEKIAKILKTSCYDCHSNETAYPWYSNIAPVSWWVKEHVEDGKKHLNFSVWSSYNAKKADHKLEEMYEEVEENEMPLSSYTLMHGEAELSEDDKKLLINWIKSVRKSNLIGVTN